MKNSNRHRQSIPSTGLTVVVSPEKPLLDVVFVHGFTGHPVRTWTHKKGDRSGNQHGHEEDEPSEPPPKIQKLNPFSKSRVWFLLLFSRLFIIQRLPGGGNTDTPLSLTARNHSP